MWQFEGRHYPNIGLNSVAGKPKEGIGLDPIRFDEMRPGCYDIKARLQDMDEDGIHAQMCFPSFPGFAGSTFFGAEDKHLAYECVRAWNDFIDEWCAAAPDRMIPMELVPYWDADRSQAEVERIAAIGARAISFTESPHAVGLPSFHVGSGGAPNVSPDANLGVAIALFGTNSQFTCTELLLSPTFHKFPRLRVALSEGGIGWMPWLVERIEYTRERHRHHTGMNEYVRPSDLFRDHIFGSSSPTRPASRSATRSASTTSCSRATTPTATATGPTAARCWPRRCSTGVRLPRLSATPGGGRGRGSGGRRSTLYEVSVPKRSAVNGRDSRARRLSEVAIVDAAQRLTRQVGVERLTMRALADALGASPMAPYHYVKGRDVLLLLVIERVMSDVEPPDPVSDQPWDEQLWEYMQAMGQALAQYPGITDYLLNHELSDAPRRYMEQCIAILRRGGFSADDARTAFTVIYTYMWGGSIFQGVQNRRKASGRRRSRGGSVPTIDELASVRAVEVGYQTIVAGLRTTMATTDPRS